MLISDRTFWIPDPMKNDGHHWVGNFCDAIEEYDPQTNEWREVGNIE